MQHERTSSNWMQTYTGHAFYPLDPRPEDIDILDIAHALAHNCRYTGHVRRFYSVAEHSVLIARACRSEHALWGLLHDGSEAYLQDISRPLKPYLANYAEIEEAVMRAIALRFDLPWPMPKEIKALDTQILVNERTALLGPPPIPWRGTSEPLPDTIIHAWNPGIAETEFLIAFAKYMPRGFISDDEVATWWRNNYA